MGKGLGIATLVVAVIAIVIPVYGIYLGILTALIGIGVAALREKAMAVAIGALNILDAVFLTPSLRMASKGWALMGSPSHVTEMRTIFWVWIASSVAAIVVAILVGRSKAGPATSAQA
jgi:hypothetical protein